MQIDYPEIWNIGIPKKASRDNFKQTDIPGESSGNILGRFVRIEWLKFNSWF